MAGVQGCSDPVIFGGVVLATIAHSSPHSAFLFYFRRRPPDLSNVWCADGLSTDLKKKMGSVAAAPLDVRHRLGVGIGQGSASDLHLLTASLSS